MSTSNFIIDHVGTRRVQWGKNDTFIKILIADVKAGETIWVKVYGEYKGSIGKVLFDSKKNRYYIRFDSSHKKIIHQYYPEPMEIVTDYSGNGEYNRINVPVKKKLVYDRLGRTIEVGTIGFAPLYIGSRASLELCEVTKITSVGNVEVKTIPLHEKEKSHTAKLTNNKDFLIFDKDLHDNIVVARLKA